MDLVTTRGGDSWIKVAAAGAEDFIGICPARADCVVPNHIGQVRVLQVRVFQERVCQVRV